METELIENYNEDEPMTMDELTENDNNIQDNMRDSVTVISRHIRMNTSNRITSLSQESFQFYNLIERLHEYFEPSNKPSYEPIINKEQNKILDETKTKNIECPITYDIIQYGDEYSTCDGCKYNFKYEAIAQHLEVCSEKANYDCPMCRNEWTNKYKYVNKLSKEEEIQKIVSSLNNNGYDSYKPIYLPKSILTNNYKKRHNKKWFYK